jgi:hypothetical protein
MAGLGGETIWPEDFEFMAKVLSQMVKEKRAQKYVYWIGFEE